MWTCPKCGRTFARTNQSHSCGERPLSVDEYLARQPEDIRPELEQMRDILKRALPDAEERISWSMPTLWQGHNLIHFAAAKHHIGLYPGGCCRPSLQGRAGRQICLKQRQHPDSLRRNRCRPCHTHCPLVPRRAYIAACRNAGKTLKRLGMGCRSPLPSCGRPAHSMRSVHACADSTCRADAGAQREAPRRVPRRQPL